MYVKDAKVDQIKGGTKITDKGSQSISVCLPHTPALDFEHNSAWLHWAAFAHLTLLGLGVPILREWYS